METVDFGKFFTVYASEMRRGEGQFFASPNILERKFRDGVELYMARDEDDSGDKWFLTDITANSLVDALMQVRDVVGNHCNTLAESTGHPAEYTASDPLYRHFREAGLLYPLEPAGIFETKTWLGPYESLPKLISRVVGAQIWAMWTIAVLHALTKATGLDHMAALPPFPCAHFCRAAKGYKEWRKRQPQGTVMVEDEGAPAICGKPDVSRSSPRARVMRMAFDFLVSDVHLGYGGIGSSHSSPSPSF